jgi:hypothetical protein
MNRQSAMSNSTDWLLQSIKRNPEGLLLVAAGAALLMRTAGSSKSKAAESNSFESTATDTVSGISGMAAETRNRASQFASSASEFASQASDRARNAAYAAGDKATSMARQTTSTAQGYASRVLEEQPLVVAVAGLAAGAALAAVFPTTEMEQETLGPIGAQVSDAAQRVGDQLKDATAAAGETLKNAARERGLSKEGLKEVAGEAADAFSSRMKGDDQSADRTSEKPEAPSSTDPRF